MDNRLRLTTTIEGIRYLANQALAFRGHDESVNSSNRGNFVEILKSFARMNIEVEKVVLDKAPHNAQYIAHDIQKQILHIFATKVKKKICAELGKNKYCILVDESLDESGKEQMAIILRFVDCDGFIRERFFDIVSVVDTNALTLKQEICKVLDNNGILVENMRGQGYDGASNMRGSWNGLQALFLQDCPYAYYVHCFAHRLQLALNGVATDVKVVWRFFSMLTNIVNFVSASAKRRNELNLIRKAELKELLDSGELETGRGLNQGRSLKRAGATRWGSHFASITSLMSLFKETKILLQEISEHGPNQQFRGDAESNYIAMMSFDSALDPRNSFKSFNIGHLCKLAEKFYPADFSPSDLKGLEIELRYFQNDMHRLPCFKDLTTLPQLCQQLVETTLAENYHLLYRLIQLVLTLPVSTTTTERAFSCMRIIKNRLRSTIADEFLADCMILHIEREFANSIDNEEIIEEFKISKPREICIFEGVGVIIRPANPWASPSRKSSAQPVVEWAELGIGCSKLGTAHRPGLGGVRDLHDNARLVRPYGTGVVPAEGSPMLKPAMCPREGFALIVESVGKVLKATIVRLNLVHVSGPHRLFILMSDSKSPFEREPNAFDGESLDDQWDTSSEAISLGAEGGEDTYVEILGEGPSSVPTHCIRKGLMTRQPVPLAMVYHDGSHVGVNQHYEF
ncbi:unnamed protein product [Prunus armeniaca]